MSMISPSPSTILVINFIVGLMSVGLLMLSAAATREVRQGLASWVFGDVTQRPRRAWCCCCSLACSSRPAGPRCNHNPPR